MLKVKQNDGVTNKITRLAQIKCCLLADTSCSFLGDTKSRWVGSHTSGYGLMMTAKPSTRSFVRLRIRVQHTYKYRCKSVQGQYYSKNRNCVCLEYGNVRSSTSIHSVYPQDRTCLGSRRESLCQPRSSEARRQQVKYDVLTRYFLFRVHAARNGPARQRLQYTWHSESTCSTCSIYTVPYYVIHWMYYWT